MPDVISANRLADGIVVFYDARGQWAEGLAMAAIFPGKAETEAALLRARADEAMNVVVDVYAFAVKPGTAPPQPVTLRDAIRAKGPTIDYASI